VSLPGALCLGRRCSDEAAAADGRGRRRAPPLRLALLRRPGRPVPERALQRSAQQHSRRAGADSAPLRTHHGQMCIFLLDYQANPGDTQQPGAQRVCQRPGRMHRCRSADPPAAVPAVRDRPRRANALMTASSAVRGAGPRRARRAMRPGTWPGRRWRASSSCASGSTEWPRSIARRWRRASARAGRRARCAGNGWSGTTARRRTPPTLACCAWTLPTRRL